MVDEPVSAAGPTAPVQQTKPEAPPMQRLTRMAMDGVTVAASNDLTKTVETATPKKKP